MNPVPKRSLCFFGRLNGHVQLSYRTRAKNGIDPPLGVPELDYENSSQKLWKNVLEIYEEGLKDKVNDINDDLIQDMFQK